MFKEESEIDSSSDSDSGESQFQPSQPKKIPKKEPIGKASPGKSENSQADDQVHVNYMITGDEKERYFSDDEAEDQIVSEIKDSNLEKDRCIKDAEYICNYLKIKCSEEPCILVVEELHYILQIWNEKGVLTLQHDMMKPKIRRLICDFLEMIFSNLEQIQYNVVKKMSSLLNVMKLKTGVFNFDLGGLEKMEKKLADQLVVLEKRFVENAKKNIRAKKKRKVIKKKKRRGYN